MEISKKDASELPLENGNYTLEGVANVAYRTSITRTDNNDNALSMCIHFTRPSSAEIPSGFPTYSAKNPKSLPGAAHNVVTFPGYPAENRYLLQISNVENTGSGSNKMLFSFIMSPS